MMPRGYDRALYILPFDHRGSFQKRMFGWNSPLNEAQTAAIAAAKRIIYDGFIAALSAGVPKEKAGILVDEQFGDAVLRDGAAEGIITACPAERSGQDEFDFEYGEDFGRHIEDFDPSFCKVLVRYNPEGNRALNRGQAARLKRLSDFLIAKNRSRLMFELLVPAEKAQLDRLKGDRKVYDRELRPQLMVGAIEELQAAGSTRTFGRSRVSSGARIAKGSWRRRGPAAAIGSVASFSGMARMTPKFGSGWRRPPASPASSDLP
jgi:myo-inositol catabolism protein IolC